MYDDILLPFDGSDGAVDVLEHARDIASRTDATIHLLYVADTTRNSATVVDDRVVDGLVQRGEEVLEEATSSLGTPGVAYETEVVQGNPAPTIAEYAERYGHDLVVMPTHGREGVSRYLVGSVSEKVVRLSSVPVLTARMQSDERLTFPYENVLVPTDGSAAASRASEHGITLAESLDATVHALSAVDDSSVGLDVRATSSGQDSDGVAREAVEDVASTASARGVSETVTHVESGAPVEVILDYVRSNDVDAVVMGTTGRRGTERILFGSVAEKTVRSAPVPVITVAELS